MFEEAMVPDKRAHCMQPTNWCSELQLCQVMQVEFPESKKGRLTLDIATVTFTTYARTFKKGEGWTSSLVPYPEGEAQVITDGLTDLEEEAQVSCSWHAAPQTLLQKIERSYYDSNTTAREEGSKAKAEREKFFPLELIARGYRINVCHHFHYFLDC